MHEINVDFAGLTGASAAGSVATIQTGRAGLSGDFSVLYNGYAGSEETPHLRYDSTALEMKRALENLDGIGVVDVTTSVYGENAGNMGTGHNQREWTVTFLTETSNRR